MKQIVISGANGFIGQNLVRRFEQMEGFEPVPLTRRDEPDHWLCAIARADGIIHLAGVTQSDDWNEMYNGNVEPAKLIANAMKESGNRAPIIYSSTVKVDAHTPYGITKKAAEDILISSARERLAHIALFRLPHVFGPLARINYNSIVVTMCAEHAQDKPLSFKNPDAPLQLAYIEDVVQAFAEALVETLEPSIYRSITPLFYTTVGDIAEAIRCFSPTSSGSASALDARLVMALHATYRSFLATDRATAG